jgi:hypothetical protein
VTTGIWQPISSFTAFAILFYNFLFHCISLNVLFFQLCGANCSGFSELSYLNACLNLEVNQHHNSFHYSASDIKFSAHK